MIVLKVDGVEPLGVEEGGFLDSLEVVVTEIQGEQLAESTDVVLRHFRQGVVRQIQNLQNTITCSYLLSHFERFIVFQRKRCVNPYLENVLDWVEEPCLDHGDVVP